jgi:BASS family bile acid:Na+ symporter
MILMVLMWVLNFDNLIGVIGTGAIIALLVFIILTFVAGYCPGRPGQGHQAGDGAGQGAAQRLGGELGKRVERSSG